VASDAVPRRIAVAGGGTGGHTLLAVELLRAYRREFGAEGYIIGCAAGFEKHLVPARGERLEIIPGLPWGREAWGGRIAALATVPRAVLAARRLLRRERTQLLIGTGGYASFGACIAARWLGLPVVIHEANVQPGLANCVVGKLAHRVCLGFAEALRYFPGGVVTGTPCAPVSPAAAPDGAPFRFLVLGGSEGSPFLNAHAPLLFGELRTRNIAFSVHHIAGFGDRDEVRRAYAERGVDAQVDSFVDDMPSVYAGAAFAITCPGACALSELAAAGIPALLVPLSTAAGDHQTANARVYAAATGAACVREHEWDTKRRADWIESVLSGPETLAEMRQRTLARARPHAARAVVEVCEKLLDG
jgi:UDP-N-acetylglucosamine--N-acetylmuramyl-(pentapeptide) pyrophosphoryl-undecaprenol N-acetylglucosamine transferase